MTGAGGFIGSHLVERLVQRGARVTAVVRYLSSGSRGWLERSPVADQIEFVHSDIGDAGLINNAMRGQDTVFHLAALVGIPYSYVAPGSYVRTNVEGTATVLDAARAAGVRRFVHTSTSEVYGTAQVVPIPEDHPLQTQSPYSATKAAADLLAWSYHRSFDLNVVVVRPFNTFGPRQTARAIIPTIISQALTSDEIRLGNLEPTRDFTFVSDTVEGFLHLANATDASGQVINLGTGDEISVGDLASRIQSLTGSRASIVSDAARARPTASEVERLRADNSRARALGWSPRVSLDDGLIATIAWIRDHLEHFRPKSYSI